MTRRVACAAAMFVPPPLFLSPVTFFPLLCPDPQFSLHHPSQPTHRHAACSASKLHLESIHFSPCAISHHSTQFASFLSLITVSDCFYLCLCLLILCVIHLKCKLHDVGALACSRFLSTQGNARHIMGTQRIFQTSLNKPYLL